MVAAIGDDLGFGRLGAFLQLDEGAGHFAPFRIGLCHHGGEQHGRVLVEDVLDLDGGDVLAAGNDDVLGAVLDDDVAVLVEHAEIAGVKPAAGKGFLASPSRSSDSPSSRYCRGT